MKKIIPLFFLLFLAACQPPQPTVFGVPQSAWDNLTPTQKQQVINNYNQQQTINAQNAPIQNAISTAGTILNNPAIMDKNN